MSIGGTYFAAPKAAYPPGRVSPDAGHSRPIARCQADPQLRAVSLTSEEEGIGRLGPGSVDSARRCLSKSSGVGNLHQPASLAKSAGRHGCRPAYDALRWAEFNPWQAPMGSKHRPLLN